MRRATSRSTGNSPTPMESVQSKNSGSQPLPTVRTIEPELNQIHQVKSRMLTESRGTTSWSPLAWLATMLLQSQIKPLTPQCNQPLRLPIHLPHLPPLPMSTRTASSQHHTTSQHPTFTLLKCRYTCHPTTHRYLRHKSRLLLTPHATDICSVMHCYWMISVRWNRYGSVLRTPINPHTSLPIRWERHDWTRLTRMDVKLLSTSLTYYIPLTFLRT